MYSRQMSALTAPATNIQFVSYIPQISNFLRVTFNNSFKMKRITKDKSSKATVMSESTINRSYSTRSKSTIEELAQEDTKLDVNLDLSEFKFTKKKALPHKKKEINRSHVTVEYDNTKIKVEPEFPLKLESDLKPEEEHDKQKHIGDLPIKNKLPVKIETKNELSIKHTKINIKKIKWEPPNWEDILKNLREMRKEQNAPVDTTCAGKSSPPQIMRYHALILLMLSTRTKDHITYVAMLKLISYGLTVENILKTSDEKLGELIYPVGFWKSKVKYIKKTSAILKNQYNSDIPNTLEKLCKLPGVGPKIAHICMKTAWGEVTGVDTHVHRISNRLGWVRNTKTPEATRKELEDWLPQEFWSEVNHLLVGFGQQICQPVKPQCATCLNYELCPFGRSYLKTNMKKIKNK